MKQSHKSHLIAYRDYHKLPGPFLSGILRSDLQEAVAWKDWEDSEDLGDIIIWCNDNLPPGSWGTRKRVKDWVTLKE